jgi:hypothetical protein
MAEASPQPSPSKINNGAVTIGADATVESEIMKSHVPLVFMITFIVGIMTALIVILRI